MCPGAPSAVPSPPAPSLIPVWQPGTSPVKHCLPVLFHQACFACSSVELWVCQGSLGLALWPSDAHFLFSVLQLLHLLMVGRGDGGAQRRCLELQPQLPGVCLSHIHYPTPTGTPILCPSQLHVLLFNLFSYLMNPLSSSCHYHKHLGIRSSTGAWGTYQWLLKKSDSHSLSNPPPVAPELGLGSREPLPSLCWNF